MTSEPLTHDTTVAGWAPPLIEIVRATDVAIVGKYWSSYTGRMFDSLAAEGPYDMLTGGDLYACALLSAEIDPSVGARLLDEEADTTSALLGQIPTDVTIRSRRAREVLSDDSPASRLYQHLRGLPSIGPTRASKLLSVKRPGLVPIRDSYVERALDATNQPRWWTPMVDAWAAPELGLAVDDLRDRAGERVPACVTDARLLDVAVWRHVETGHAK